MRYDNEDKELSLEDKISNLKEAILMINYRNDSFHSRDYLPEWMDSVTESLTILTDLILDLRSKEDENL